MIEESWSTDELTPCEIRAGRWYKREDMFAPMGYGGPNGAKLRQLIHLVERRGERPKGILTGASVLSPQISMAALVGRHYGIPVKIVIGAANVITAARHPNVRIALDAGAEFHFVEVGYNPYLQGVVNRLAPEHEGWMKLCYGITTEPEDGDEAVTAFHAVGAEQVRNIPDEVTTIYCPLGSANSATSLLYGLAKFPAHRVERVILFGIGPTKLQWMHDRLAQIERSSGLKIQERYRTHYETKPLFPSEAPEPGHTEMDLLHYDLHGTGFADYGDRVPYELDGIKFHPTYEGKILAYMGSRIKALCDDWWYPNGTALFWIVGSEPNPAVVARALA